MKRAEYLKTGERNKITKVANALIKKYFRSSPPKLRWKRVRWENLGTERNPIHMTRLGLADLGRNIISLNPVSTASLGKTKLKLVGAERYFLTLLHETGHSKIKPNENVRALDWSRKEFKKQRAWIRGRLGKEGLI